MIDNRFSADSFRQHDKDSPENAALQKALAEEIATALHEAVSPAFSEIVGQLKSLGHRLEELPANRDDEYDSFEYEACDPQDDNMPRMWLHTLVGVMQGCASVNELE